MIYKILLALTLLIGCVTTPKPSNSEELKYSIGTCVQIEGLEGTPIDPQMQVKVFNYKIYTVNGELKYIYIYKYWMQEHNKWSDPQWSIGKKELFEGMTYEVKCPA